MYNNQNIRSNIENDLNKKTLIVFFSCGEIALFQWRQTEPFPEIFKSTIIIFPEYESKIETNCHIYNQWK